MRKTTLLLIILIHCIELCYSQGKNSVKEKDALLIPLTNGCFWAPEISNFYFTKNMRLFEFYQSVQNGNIFWTSDTFSYFNELLDLGEYNSNTACLLPFIRMLDMDANLVYKENCYTQSRKTSFGCYCIEPPIQFLVLFYIQNIFIDKIKIDSGCHFLKISLQKIDLVDNLELTQDDYSIIYNEYRIWLYENFILRRKRSLDPLKLSNYKWVIEYCQTDDLAYCPR